MNTKKILVKIWKPLLDKLNVMSKDSCIKRDSYLNLVLSHEAVMLDKEVVQSNSEKAKKYLSSKLIELDNFKSVNLLLEEETIEKINNTCKGKNIPRDSFINRVLLLLTANSDTLEDLFEGYGDTIPDVVADNDHEHYFAYRANIFDTISEFIETDPFWLLRGCLCKMKEYDEDIIESLHINNFHRITGKPDSLIDYSDISLEGFNCFISDDLFDFMVLFNNDSDLEERKESRRLEATKLKEKLKRKVS